MVAKDPEPVGGANLAELEESLKKIIAQAGNVPGAGVVAAAGGSEETQKLSTEIAKLKSDLEAKQKEIESISAQAASAVGAGAGAPAAAGISADDKTKLEVQLKELEAKLSEYEIISEDIADLSYYKEQNAELQKQLQALKSGGAAPASAAPAPAEAAAPANAPAATSAPAPSNPEPTIAGKSKVAQANAAIAEAAPAAQPAAPPPPTPTPVEAAPAENLVDDSLLAGFEEAVKSQEPAAEFDLGQMDVDKMLNEAADISIPSDDVDIEKELSGTVDEDKLLKEAVTLDAITPEDKRLMGQFENFVKKGE